MPDDRDVSELRSSERYNVKPPIMGAFGAFEISVIDFSKHGLQIRHLEPLKLGVEARLAFMAAGSRHSWRGKILWSHMARLPDAEGKHPYFSGVFIEEHESVVEELLDHLLEAGLAEPDHASIERKKQILRERSKERAAQRAVKIIATAKPSDITTDQMLMITGARERLQTHPDEAKKWYARAKFVLSEDQSRVGISAQLHHREDVLAVWEYLERSIDLDKILRVFEELHKK